jgi:cytochrome c-type biogenesis protein CcmH
MTPARVARVRSPRTVRRLALAMMLVASSLWILPVTALAQDTTDARAALSGAELEALTREVASQLRCPVCQGESIQDSPSGLAQDMRSVVRDQLAAGRTPDEVKAYFVARYGEWILLQPTARGFNVVVYALPFLALLAGAAAIVLAVRRWTLGASEIPAGADDSPPPDR